MRKYAAATLFDPQIARADDLRAFRRTAHRVDFDYNPRPGYLYVRSRMISSRCNDNFDEFSAEEIKGDGRTTGYVTFLGKPVFVNHHNEDHRRARGVILDAALHEDRNPDGSPDTWSEGLMEVDAVRFPKLAEAVMKGWIDRTSMGVDVERSQCSKCGNLATSPMEYCRHIPAMKGSRIRTVTASGQPQSHLVRERCYGLRFFENSLLVEEPADPTAFFLDTPRMGPKEAKAQRYDGVGLSQDDQGWYVHTHRARSESYDSPEAIPDGRIDFIRSTGARQQKGTFMDLKVAVRRCGMCFSPNTITLSGMNECGDCGYLGDVPLGSGIRDLRSAARVPMHPSQKKFFKENPVHSDHIVNAWNDASDDEKDQGKRWYHDAHLTAKAMTSLHKGPEHPHGNMHLASGLIANYSPQQGWAGNMHNAARVLHEGKARGGPGEGIMATSQQKGVAHAMLNGAHFHDAYTSDAHKVRDFQHLIEHGDDTDDNHPRVVIDRHALGVAAGRRMSDKDYGRFPKSERDSYDHVAGAYHEAAQRISQATGEHVKAHQVQAVTWLRQQRVNKAQEDDDRANGRLTPNQEKLNRGRDTNRANDERKWNNFRDEHLPHLPAEPGTGYDNMGGKSTQRPQPAPEQKSASRRRSPDFR